MSKFGGPVEHREIKQTHIDGIKPASPHGSRRYDLREKITPGFVVRVRDTGHWAYGVYRRIGPSAPVFRKIDAGTLAAARQKAREWVQLMKAGVDPSEAERAATESKNAAALAAQDNTFAARWKQYEAKHIASLKPRTQDEVKRPYRLHFEPAFGTLPLSHLRRGQISDLLDKIAAPVAANRAYAVIRHFTRWCVRKGYLDADPCPMEAPNVEGPGRDRTLTDAELIALWGVSLSHPVGTFLRFLILTGQRRNEVAGMRWSEVKGENWHIPADRTKASRAQIIPLPRIALAVLAECKRIAGCDYVFSLNGANHILHFSKIKAEIDEASKVAEWRFHDIRRTVSTGMEKLGIPYPVRAAVLNHSKVAAEGVTAIYSRHDYLEEKRVALAAWAAHVNELANPPAQKKATKGRAKLHVVGT